MSACLPEDNSDTKVYISKKFTEPDASVVIVEATLLDDNAAAELLVCKAFVTTPQCLMELDPDVQVRFTCSSTIKATETEPTHDMTCFLHS